ncbi:efflux RND transporter periplasmic adaptor subunit [Luteimonas sp. R10]|uniref:efflux RND transporter periplasmic adaptor subunit n=1 Tax=Luteimonas sp. R10 TaxID=3108176 RepID=UPI00308C18C5|nr:efflux RND transporter periplasmic adaptor subunit [Luteimonas sp. R10]
MSIHRFRPLAVLVLALASVLALAACGDGSGQGGGRAPAGNAATVTTATVQVQPWSDTIQALGTVKARESIMVTAKVSETVERVHFESGDVVAAGDVLVTLSGNQQHAALAAAEAAAAEADRLHERQSQLAAQQLISSSSLDTQRAVRDSARARVQEIRANLGDRSIRAPFPGVLGLRLVSPGSLVQPGTEIASLDDVSRVYVDFPVPEAQLANLAPGQRLIGRSVAYPGREFEGTVATVDSRIDPNTRAVTVRGDFPNADGALRPGLLMQVVLERPAREALVVPEIAIVQVGRDTFVYRVREDDTVEQAPIEVGARVAGRAEVVSGLSGGDRIVVDGTGKLRTGMAIEDTGPPAQPTPAPDAAQADQADQGRIETPAPAND